MIGRLLAWLGWHVCTCDPRFVPVVRDIDCPLHGLVSQIEGHTAP